MKKGIWKKVAVIAATMAMILAMTACGKTIEIELGETTVIEGCAEFTAENVLVSPQVFPPICDEEPMGWVLDDETKTYVTIVTTIKNLSEKAMTTDDLWSDFFVVLDGEYTDGTIVAVTTKNDTVLSDSASIEVGKTETVYFITEVEKDDLAKLTSTEFDFDGTTVTLGVDATKPVAQYETLTMKDTYKVENLGKVTPKSMKFMEELEPSNPGYTYDYYAAQSDDDKLLVLTTKVENSSKKSKSAYRYFNLLAFVNDEVYLGDVVADDEYAANITGSEKIESGGTRNVYGIINLPKSVKKADCEIYVYIDGTYYQYAMK